VKHLVVLALLAGCCPHPSPAAMQITLRDGSGALISNAQLTCVLDGISASTNGSMGVYTCGDWPGDYTTTITIGGTVLNSGMVHVPQNDGECGGARTVSLTVTIGATSGDAGPADASVDH
jgi:hypothetical protein